MARLPVVVALLAGAALSVAVVPGVSAVFAQPAGMKKPVKTADDLPRHTYKIEGKASEFVLTDGPYKAFLAQVKTNLESDLAGYDITDPTTLQGYYNALMSIAMIEGRFEDAVRLADKVKDLETKEAQKIYAGTSVRAIAKAKAAGGGEAAVRAAFAKELDAAVRAMPWEKVREIVVRNKGTAEIITRDLLLGQMQASLDPVVEKSGGEVSGDLAKGLLAVRSQLDVMLPLREEVVATFSKIIEDNATAAKDIWAERSVVLSEKDGLTPVVIGVWDSGVDQAIFEKTAQAWTNTNEKVNGKDDDQNGFVDDVHGIAFDLDSQPVVDLLHPLTALKGDKAEVLKYTKGLTDLQANIDSPDAAALRKHLGTLKGEAVGTFMEDLSLYGNHMHGTHVSGIAAEGNPAARILAARITFDYKQIPTKAPSVEDMQAIVGAAKATVNYFKAAGVRVVNMSWGLSRQDVEGQLEQKNVGKTAEERAEMSRRIFNTIKEGLDEAMRSAPDILFIAAAGNSNNNSQFSEMIPSGLEIGNMITVGAVDQSGKPTGFTTFGKNVRLYSNGFEVESYIPGGGRMKASGTSMAAPNVANLAAKLFALDPKLSSKDVVDLMMKGADPMPGSSEADGRLLINPKKSVELLKKRGG
ncbi:MAG: S8 family serine peptidase [Phycisphaerales bacterium]